MESLKMLDGKFSPQAMLASLTALATASAQAAGPSGTEGVAEMQLTGAQLGMLLGGAVALGVVLWLLIRFLNK